MTLKIISENFRERVENDDCEDDDRGANFCDCLHDAPIVNNIF